MCVQAHSGDGNLFVMRDASLSIPNQTVRAFEAGAVVAIRPLAVDAYNAANNKAPRDIVNDVNTIKNKFDEDGRLPIESISGTEYALFHPNLKGLPVVKQNEIYINPDLEMELFTYNHYQIYSNTIYELDKQQIDGKVINLAINAEFLNPGDVFGIRTGSNYTDLYGSSETQYQVSLNSAYLDQYLSLSEGIEFSPLIHPPLGYSERPVLIVNGEHASDYALGLDLPVTYSNDFGFSLPPDSFVFIRYEGIYKNTTNSTCEYVFTIIKG